MHQYWRVVCCLLVVVLFVAALVDVRGSGIADEQMLLLRTGNFDPLAAEPAPLRLGRIELETTNIAARARRLALTAAVRGDGAYFIVQFNGPILPEQTERLITQGYVIAGYIPNHAYIIGARGRLSETLSAQSSEYRWVGAYGAGLKIEPELARLADESANAPSTPDQTVLIAVSGFPDANAEGVRSLAAAIDPDAVFELRADGRWRAVMRVAHADLASTVSELAGIEGVEWIEQRRVRRLLNDNAVRVIQSGGTAAEGGDTPLYRRGLTGAGQIYAAADSGLDTDHAQFRFDNQPASQTLSFAVSTSALMNGQLPVSITNPNNKVLVYYLLGTSAFIPNANNPHGERTLDPDRRQGTRYLNSLAYDDSSGGFHGTATTSVAVGRHFAASGAGAVPGLASRTTADGIAPDARIVFQDIGHVSGQLPGVDFISQMFVHEQAYSSGARIHNNSYGPDRPVGYDVDAADIDDIMWKRRDYTIFYSAGNEGSAPRSITNEAKNNVLVAATESPTNGGNTENITSFSSHGPTFDGRIKPDISAPGVVRAATEFSGQAATGFTNTTSTTALDAGINPRAPNNNQDLRNTSGTSFASPLAAGGALLVRQYFVDGFYPGGEKNSSPGFNPSNALVKAMVIISGRNMTGGFTANDGSGGARGSMPNFGQGWGRLTLDDALYFSGDRRELLVLADIFNGATANNATRPAPNPAIRTGETHTYTIDNVSPIEPLRISLVWSDPRATINTSVALVNNLDLEVIDPQGGVYRGNVNFMDAHSQPANGAAFDNRNPVECVYIRYPLPGAYTVRVIGANVPGNGMIAVTAQPGAESIDSNRQGYALAATGNFTAGALPVVAVGAATIGGGVNSDGFIGRNETVTATVEVANPGAVDALGVNVSVEIAAGSEIPPSLVRVNGGASGEGAAFNYGDIPAGTVRSAAFQVTLADDGQVRAGQRIVFNVTMTPANGIPFVTSFSIVAHQRLYVYRTRFEPAPDPGDGEGRGETLIVIPESEWSLRADNPNPSPQGDVLFFSSPWTLTTALKAAGGSTASLADPSGVGTSYGTSSTSRAGGGIFDDTRWWTTRKIVLPGLNVSPATGLVTNPEATRQLRAVIDSYDVDVNADFTGDNPQANSVGDLFFLRLRTYRNTASTASSTDAGFNEVSFTNLLLIDSSTPSTGGFKHFGGGAFAMGDGRFGVDEAIPNNSDVAFRLELQLRRNAFAQTGDGVAVDNLVVRLRVGDATVYPALPAQTVTSVDAASFVRAAAAGQILAAFGAGMPAGLNFTSVAQNLPLPDLLNDVSVRVNGKAAPLFFVSTNSGVFQINYQLPYETPKGTALVEVVHQGAVIASEFLEVGAAAPGIFTLTSDGQGQAVALNEDFSLNEGSRPAGRGRFIIVYATGQGTALLDASTLEQRTPPSGAAAGADALFITAGNPEVTIGGAPAAVGFSGLAPGFVGLWQMNIRVPDEAPVSPAAELVVTFGGRLSRTVTIAVN
ncbi:MAG: S8 family serine peptidase [Acidobacteria bacterium]|nr:S8 family serine peptidase [Acidobacteriota bacterium]